MIPGRLPGIVALGVRRVRGRLTGPAPGRTVVCCAGVAGAIAVLVVVTGLSLGLAGGETVRSADVNYWIVPDQDGAGTTPLAFEGARLGEVHETAARIRADDRVGYATPVAIQPIRLEATDHDERAHVLALGVVPPPDGRTVAGIETAPLDDAYPFYADGGYGGEWTGELVASPGALDQLGVERGDELHASGSDRTFTVEGVADEDATVGVGEAPVVLGHLAEIQAVTDTTAGDQADQILVATTDAGVREDLADAYPRTSVVSRSGLSGMGTGPSDLPVAMAAAAGLVALGIGVAFVATMMGLELTATRRSLAVLAAVGYGRASVAVLLLTETVTIALLGGVVGVGLGGLGILALDGGIVDLLGLPAVATFDPLLVGYGLGAAVLVGLLSVAYPLYVAWRTDPLGELAR